MGLETSTYIDGLNTSNPAATDGLAQADDHIRLLKTTVKNTFPNITGPVTATAAELNKLDGTDVTTASLNKLQDITATAAELNRLDGITATTTELNYTDGVTSNIQTQLNGKASTGITISAGSGLTGGGSLSANRTISHADTSSQGSINNSGNTVIQDITLDTYGHVTSIGSKTIDITGTVAAQTAGTVGSYAYMNSGTSVLSPNATVSGSSLRYSSVAAYDTGVQAGNVYITGGGTASGTWRLMGQTVANGTYKHTSLWLRIS